MALAFTIAHIADRLLKMPAARVYAPGWTPLPSASPGGSLKSVGETDLGFFQITASALSPGVSEILCEPSFWLESLFLTALWLSWKKVPLTLKAGGSFSQCKNPGLRSLMCSLNHLLLKKNLHSCNFSPYLWFVPHRYIYLLLISLWFLFYICGCRRSVMLVFWSFSSIHAL